jgi:hypothetical protein
VLYLNAAAVPVLEADCQIPTGTPLVASPGGIFDWDSTNSMTDAELLALRDLDFQTNIDPNPSATLDGQPLDVQSGFAKTGVYTISVAPGSLIPTVDPTFPAGQTQVRIASAVWIVRIQPLPPGSHTLVLADTIGGTPFTATFHITVRPGSS